MSAVEVRTLGGPTQWRLARFVVLQPVDEDEDDRAHANVTEPGDDNEATPTLDGDGLLRFRGRWVAVPEAQLDLVRLLLARFQTTVSDDDLLKAFGCAPGAGAGRRLAGALHRLRARVSECGLTLCRVRTRGYILDYAESVSEPSESWVSPSV